MYIRWKEKPRDPKVGDMISTINGVQVVEDIGPRSTSCIWSKASGSMASHDKSNAISRAFKIATWTILIIVSVSGRL